MGLSIHCNDFIMPTLALGLNTKEKTDGFVEDLYCIGNEAERRWNRWGSMSGSEKEMRRGLEKDYFTGT